MKSKGTILWSVLGIVALGLARGALRPERAQGSEEGGGAVSDVAVAAQKTYVAPGDLDEYYLFSSGGHSGQVYVYGVPSMRHLSTIPVYTPYPATGYGFDDETQGDARRPHLGRRPPPRALRDEGRLRRPLALRQRHERPRRPHRPARLQDQADLRPGAQRLRQPRLGLRHAQHRVLDDGLALLDPDPQGDGGAASTSTPPTTRAWWPAIKIDPKTRRDVAGLARS